MSEPRWTVCKQEPHADGDGHRCASIDGSACVKPCQHEPDPTSIRPADAMEWVVDIWCRKCGVSGSMRIDPKDVDFGDEEGKSC